MAAWAEKEDDVRRAQLNIMISNDSKPEDQGTRRKKFSVKFCLYNKCKDALLRNVDFDNFIENISANRIRFFPYLLNASNDSFEIFLSISPSDGKSSASPADIVLIFKGGVPDKKVKTGYFVNFFSAVPGNCFPQGHRGHPLSSSRSV